MALGERLGSSQTDFKAPNKRILITLLENGADINAKSQGGETALTFAAAYLDNDIVKLLVKYGADVNATSDGGYTALHLLVLRNDPDLIIYMVEHGANVNARTRSGATPLHLAVGLCGLQIIRLLLNRGADPNARDSYEGTPLARMAMYGPDPGYRTEFQQTIPLLKRYGGRLEFGDAIKRLPSKVVQVYIKRVNSKPP